MRRAKRLRNWRLRRRSGGDGCLLLRNFSCSSSCVSARAPQQAASSPGWTSHSSARPGGARLRSDSLGFGGVLKRYKLLLREDFFRQRQAVADRQHPLVVEVLAMPSSWDCSRRKRRRRTGRSLFSAKARASARSSCDERVAFHKRVERSSAGLLAVIAAASRCVSVEGRSALSNGSDTPPTASSAA